MSKSILIMLALYNGEKYIKEQIESIINQDYDNWRLIIQDDGSTDQSWQIVKHYCERDKRISLVRNESGYHGAFCNFHALANRCKNGKQFDIYMFADQDDIWKQKKLSFFASKLKNEAAPCLCYADMDTIDGDGKQIDSSVDKVMGIRYTNRYRPFFAHKVYGCNAAMNAALFFSVPKIHLDKEYVKILSHDNLYTKFAVALGKVKYYPIVTMHYRRHEENVTASQQYKFNLGVVLRRVMDLDTLAKDHAKTYNQTLIAIKMLRGFKQVDQIFLDNIEQVILDGGLKGLWFIHREHIRWGTLLSDFSRRITMLTGKYKKYLLIIDEI